MATRARFAKPDYWSPLQPQWGYPCLPHIMVLPDPQIWARYWFQGLKDIMPTGPLLSIGVLSVNFRLPRWMYFRYFQLQHAVCSQFPNPPTLETDPIEELLVQESLPKPLCVLYLSLLSKLDRLWEQWHGRSTLRIALG